MRFDGWKASLRAVGAGRSGFVSPPGAQALRRRRPRGRTLLYVWAFPTTAVGLVIYAIASVGGHARSNIVRGVLEVHGGFVTWFLKHCTFLKGGASAMTLGHVVLGRDAFLLDVTRDHERVHVRQCERWGPFFLPAYGLASLYVLLRGGRPYEDNPFEREAYGCAGMRNTGLKS